MGSAILSPRVAVAIFKRAQGLLRNGKKLGGGLKMPDARALYVHPKGADLSALKAAVLELDLPYSVRPFWAEVGQLGPVIDLDGTYQYLTESLYPKTPEAMKLAVLHALGEKTLTRGPTTTLDKLKRNLGEDVREVQDEWPE